MGLNLHQNMRGFLMEVIAPALAIGEEAPDRRSLHHRRVVLIGRQYVIRRLLIGILDHLEQRLLLGLTIDHPVGVENLVTAVFGVSLSEHVQLDVAGVALQAGERRHEVVHLILRQRQPQAQVSLL